MKNNKVEEEEVYPGSIHHRHQDDDAWQRAIDDVWESVWVGTMEKLFDATFSHESLGIVSVNASSDELSRIWSKDFDDSGCEMDDIVIDDSHRLRKWDDVIKLWDLVEHPLAQ